VPWDCQAALAQADGAGPPALRPRLSPRRAPAAVRRAAHAAATFLRRQAAGAPAQSDGLPARRQGRNFAFWKREVTDMLRDACASWLGAFRMDGLRFDSANDLPPQTVQALTWALRERFPGHILTAEARARAPGFRMSQLWLEFQ